MNAPLRHPLPTDRDALFDAAEMRARQHHSPACPGCHLCMSGDCKIDRGYPNAPDLDCVGRTLRQGR